MNYDEFFKKATDNPGPYPYQTRLATTPELPQLLDIPTGCGKTAAVVLAWLWRRRFAEDEVRKNTPRRLVYCLPMRVLVEQTRDNCIDWLKNLELLGGSVEDGEYSPSWQDPEKINVTVLMGGEDRDDWDMYPERDAIIIGTQDMLLSRALNRGYGMSRYRWPVHFGLLNNDCLWVMDEVQLMGNGLATSVQLQLFQKYFWKTAIDNRFIWMSATPGEGIFSTRDRNDAGIGKIDHSEEMKLPEKEKLNISSYIAEKEIIKLEKEPKNLLKDGILDIHKNKQLSLIVINTVSGAQSWYNRIICGIEKIKKKTKDSGIPKVILLHGRMRPCDRKNKVDMILDFSRKKKEKSLKMEDPGLIVVTTQVIETGMDISADQLWSEIATWPSIIQRLGRLNRYGKQNDTAKAFFWMPKSDREITNHKDSPNAGRIGPYEKEAINKSNKLVEDLQKNLEKNMDYYEALENVLKTTNSIETQKISYESVIRPQDLHGLFSTEPDLAGGFTDISCFIRDSDNDSNVRVFWSDFKERPSNEIALRDYLCPVSTFNVKTFLEKNNTIAWEWNSEEHHYQKVKPKEICSGMTLLISQTKGGYSEMQGWTGNTNDMPTTNLAELKNSESLMGDKWSESNWLDIKTHLNDAIDEAKQIVGFFDLPDMQKSSVIMAAEWHDIGKAHPRWQGEISAFHKRLLEKTEKLPSELRQKIYPILNETRIPPLQAKFPSWKQKILNSIDENEYREIVWKELNSRFNPRLRHEAASSAMIWKRWVKNEQNFTALSIFLIAAHHGKVRTVLRSTQGKGDVFGIQQGDKIPTMLGLLNEEEIDIHHKVFGLPGKWLNNDLFESSSPSWIAVVSELLGKALPDDIDIVGSIPDNEPKALGPFRLSFLEALVVAVDIRASMNENDEVIE